MEKTPSFNFLQVRRSKHRYNFVIMDFEFTTIKKNIVLISGAMTCYGNRNEVKKLKGNPLILTVDGSIMKFDREESHHLKNYMKMILRNKQEMLKSITNELNISLSTPIESSTLVPEIMIKYLVKQGNRPVIVLWNGQSDREILKRLQMTFALILNLTTYDEHNNNYHHLKLKDFETNEVICSHEIGHFIKNGRMLSLDDAHSMVCSANHDITYLHDPAIDVLYTKCIFNYLVELEGYRNLEDRLIDYCF